VDRLYIQNGTYNLEGLAGIGASRRGTTSFITFMGPARSQITLDCTIDTRETVACIKADNMVARTVEITAKTNTPTFIDSGWGPSTDLSGVLFSGSYKGQSEHDFFGTAPILHLAKVLGLSADRYGLQFRGQNTNNIKAVWFDARDSWGISVSLPVGTYTINVLSSAGGQVGGLCQGTNKIFTVVQGETFIEQSGLCGYVGESSSSQSMSGGYSAGVAITVILFVAAIGLLVYYVVTRCFTGGYVKAESTPGYDASAP
jgi:hypothetical protein